MDAPAAASSTRPSPARFSTAVRRLVQRCALNQPKNRFDAAQEQQFWQERNAEMRQPLQAALLLGAAGFLAFVLLDAATQGLSASGWAGRLLVVLGLLGLFAYVCRPAAQAGGARLASVAGIAASMATLNLAGTLLAENSPAGYAGAWAGLLPVYFFTYGQLAMPLRASLAFGWTAWPCCWRPATGSACRPRHG